MNDKVKCGLGVSGLLGAGAALGIGGKALVQKVMAKIKERKAEKAASEVKPEEK
ncbi:MAG: hypothetical protein J6U54_10930 [Clostridiales bacterium]|nr:hypothetical protein [Clostridiales bacterium]